MAKKKKPRQKTIKLHDIGPPERRQHGDDFALELTARAGVHRTRVLTQSPCDRYYQRGLLKSYQHEAACLFSEQWQSAGKGQRVVGSYAERTDGHPESDNPAVAHAARQVEKALVLLDQSGAEFTSVIVGVAGLEQSAGEWAASCNMQRTAGLVILRLALNILARNWRLPGAHELD